MSEITESLIPAEGGLTTMTNDEYDKLLEKQGKGWKDWLVIKQERLARKISITEDMVSLALGEQMLRSDRRAVFEADRKWMRRSLEAALSQEELARQAQELRMGYEVAAYAGGWKSIDTAPKDGTTILAWDGYAVIVRWSYDEWRDDFQSYLALTHWMPLPAPPTAANPSDQEIRDAINGDY